MITKRLIEEWEKNYDITENDENEYQKIIKMVSNDINENESIKKDTFEKILRWKSPRLTGIVRLDKYETEYKPKIEKCIQDEDSHAKLDRLLLLHGIAVPTATTILHFIYPNDFPIMDIRTAKTLVHFNKLKAEYRSKENYWNFCRALIDIKNTTRKQLRTIDRALFSYHKMLISNKDLYKKSIKIKRKEIEHEHSSFKEETKKLSTTEIEKCVHELAKIYIDDKSQKNLFLQNGIWLKLKLNYIAALSLQKDGVNIFTPKDIRDTLRQLIPQISEWEDNKLSGTTLTQDVHIEAKKEYNNGYYCLEKVNKGHYKFVGLKRK